MVSTYVLVVWDIRFLSTYLIEEERGRQYIQSKQETKQADKQEQEVDGNKYVRITSIAPP